MFYAQIITFGKMFGHFLNVNTDRLGLEFVGNFDPEIVA